MEAKILHIITGLDQGGAERSLVNLLGSDFSRRFDNRVLSLGGLGHYGLLLRERGIGVDALDLKGAGSIPAGLTRLRRVVRHARPDIIQGWMYHGNLFAEAARLFWPSARTAWNVRQSLYDLAAEKRGTQMVIRLLKMFSGRPRAILYNSHQSRTHHESFGFATARGRVIPNGFDTKRWRPDAERRSLFRKTLGLKERARVLGFVGRFHPQKDVPTFLAAAAGAMTAHPDLHVVMVGEGLGADGAALAHWRGRLPNGRFHPLGRRDDVERILPGFDLFCLSSSSEAFPNVLGEAMACGLPCIATDVGDCARLMGGAGRIVPPGDAVQMAKAIGDIASMDLAQRAEIGEAARARIIATYGLDATVDAYAELYDMIMKRDC